MKLIKKIVAMFENVSVNFNMFTNHKDSRKRRNKKMSIVRNINKVIKALGKTYRGLAPYAIFR